MLPAWRRVWVEIEGRREGPCTPARVEKPMVPQMIVCVGDEDGESHPPPEFVQIIGGPEGDHLDRGSDVQVAPDIAVPSFEHRHRAHVADPTVIFTVES